MNKKEIQKLKKKRKSPLTIQQQYLEDKKKARLLHKNIKEGKYKTNMHIILYELWRTPPYNRFTGVDKYWTTFEEDLNEKNVL